jgi:hypothetical protein
MVTVEIFKHCTELLQLDLEATSLFLLTKMSTTILAPLFLDDILGCVSSSGEGEREDDVSTRVWCHIACSMIPMDDLVLFMSWNSIKLEIKSLCIRVTLNKPEGMTLFSKVA